MYMTETRRVGAAASWCDFLHSDVDRIWIQHAVSHPLSVLRRVPVVHLHGFICRDAARASLVDGPTEGASVKDKSSG